jgi:formylglycine-generating enzyme required for sulfatase activity
MKIDCEGKIKIGKNRLRVKEKELMWKKNKLVKHIKKELPVDVYDISMIVLINAYEKPEELTENDEEIRNSLEYLLAGRISVKTYIHTVQCYLQNEDFERSFVLEKYREQEIPKTFISSSTGMEFVLIPAGEFMMGSEDNDNEKPVHTVIIKDSFYLGKYPVTQKQWKMVMGNNPSYSKGEDLPIESVTWNDVQAFIRELNKKEGTDKYRLPSEAEWEYACRAGTQTRYFFGDDESKLNEYAWYDKNSGSKIHPVGQKKPNFWGLYDIHGNVVEWVQDKWQSKYDGAPSDGGAWEDGDCSYRIYRGGGCENSAMLCRSASRAGLDCGNSFINAMGFRLLREL